MIVVADTSPINYLALIGRPDLLFRLYRRILIPSAVAQELSDQAAPDLVRAWLHNAPEWLETRFVSGIVDSLLYLGQGEREELHSLRISTLK